MKILIADDHDLVRDSIAAYLGSEGPFEISVASDFDSAAALIQKDGPFDLVLLDYDMPGMNGVKGLERARKINSGKPVAIISGAARRAEAQNALEAGAAGFLPKSMPAKSLINAVNFMLTGEQYAPMKFMMGEERADEHPLAAQLSKRELQVLKGLCEGFSNKDIASSIGLEEATIKLHVRSLCRKLNARNRTHAAMIAKEANLF